MFQPISADELATHTNVLSGRREFDLLLNEAVERSPVGELVDIMDVGYHYLAFVLVVTIVLTGGFD
jgi:hypothetical protein